MKTNINYTSHRLGEWITIGDFMDTASETDGLMVDGLMIESINTKTSGEKISLRGKKIESGSFANEDIIFADQSVEIYRLPSDMGATFITRRAL